MSIHSSQSRYCCAILFTGRGESFRTEFSKIGEVRSLINEEVRVIALTATATKSSRKKIRETLGMAKAIVISEPPNRPNIEYRVEKKKATIEEQFASLFEELKRKRLTMERTVIFCRTYTDCGHIYMYLKHRLGIQKTEPMGASDLAKYRLVDMFSACTTRSVRAYNNHFKTQTVH